MTLNRRAAECFPLTKRQNIIMDSYWALHFYFKPHLNGINRCFIRPPIATITSEPQMPRRIRNTPN